MFFQEKTMEKQSIKGFTNEFKEDFFRRTEILLGNTGGLRRIFGALTKIVVIGQTDLSLRADCNNESSG